MSDSAATYSPVAKPVYFGALDGLRGSLAVVVAVHHTAWFSYVNYYSFINDAFVLIDLFFALSGFLLYTLYHKKLNTRDDCVIFLKRRFARLYPLHFFMLMVFVAYCIARIYANKSGLVAYEPGEALPFHAGAEESWALFFSNIFLTHSLGFHDALSFNFPSWTVSVEFYTYFLFMIMMVWAAPKKAWHFILLGIVVACLYYGLSRVEAKDGGVRRMDITYDYGFLRCVAGFVIGIIAAKIFKSVKTNNLWPNKMSYQQWTVVEIATIIIGVLFLTYFTGPLQFYAGPVLLLYMVIFAFDGGYVSKLLRNKFFLYLAKISYSIYMVHSIITLVFATVGTRVLPKHIFYPEIVKGEAIGSGLGGDVYMILYLAAVILASHFTYKYVELPGGKFLRNFSFRKNKAKLA